MPIYQYEGQHYDLPDGLSNEDAIAKIEAHLGKTPSAPVVNTNTQAAIANIPGTVRPAAPDPTANASLWDKINAGVEAGANTAAGLLGSVTTGPLAAVTNVINTGVREHRLANPTELGNAFNEGVGVLTKPLEEATTPLGKEYTGKVGDLMNEALPGLMHLHTMHVEGAGVVDPRTAWAMRGDKGKAAAKPSGNAILDALDTHFKEPAPVVPASEPLVDTRSGLQKSKEAYEAALRERQLAQESAFNGKGDSNNVVTPEVQAAQENLNRQSQADQFDPVNQRAPEPIAPDHPGQLELPFTNEIPDQIKPTDVQGDLFGDGWTEQGKASDAQRVIDARNAEHDKIAQNLENTRRATEEQQRNREQASSTQQSPTMEQHAADLQAHADQIAAEEQHRTHLEETHARAMDEQAKLEAAQAAVEARQKAIDASMSGVKSQHEGIRALTAEGGPKTERLAAEADLRRRQEAAPTKSKKQLAIEAKAELAAEKARIVHQRAENEHMIQKIRDQHTESEVRTRQAQADAQESIAKRNQANTAETTKAAQEAAKLRAEAEAIAKDKAKRDKALANIAKQHALQEINLPAGSKERAIAVKTINEKFGKKSKQGGGVFFGENGVPDYKSMWENVSKRSDPKEIIKRNEAEIAAELKKTTGINYNRLEDLMHQNDNLKAVEDLKAGQKFTKDLQTGGASKKSVEPTVKSEAPTADVKNDSKAKEAGLFNADENGIVSLNSGIPLPKALKDMLELPIKGFNNMASAIMGHNFNPTTVAEDYVKNRFGEAKDILAAVGGVASPADVIAKATASGATDIPIPKDSWISASLQSGANMTAAKFRENPVLRGVADYLNNSLAKTNYQIGKLITPLNKMLNRLNPEEMATLQGILQRESTRKTLFTDDQLRAAGVNDKQLAAYKMQREAYNSAYELQNAQLKRMGEPELSKDDYYYSSRWSGDWHTPITKDRIGKDGKPIIDPETGKVKQDMVWYLRTMSKDENVKAIAYLKDKFPELNITDETQPQYMGNNRNPNAPHDVAGAYRDMMGFFKDAPETADAIKQAMESYTQAKGYTNLGQSKHFIKKAGIRGFAGDTPWLSPEESAHNGAKAQVDYLKNAIRWANTQEMVANAKQVLSNADVAKAQPNAIAFAQKLINRELGLDTNVVAPLENLIARTLGRSRNSVLKGIGDTKTMMYLQTLGFNPMYSIATPLQFVVSGPMWHSVMSSAGGYKTGVVGALKTVGFGLSDATVGVMAHMAHEMGSDTVSNFASKAGMTKIGEQALKYMEDSGYIKRNIFDESRSVGQHGVMDKVEAGMGWTIGQPERVARMMSFMSFVHHLDASGAFHGNNMALFHEAEIYADRALGSFKSFDRPLVVDKLGSLGQMAYVYQSFKFTSMHTLNAASRMLAAGNPVPLVALMSAYALGTGIMNMPGMQEMDGLVNAGKDMISKLKPDLYSPAIRDFNLKEKMIGMMPDTKAFRQLGTAKDVATNGVLGQLTGVAIAPHISPQIADTEHMSNNIPGSVLGQEAKEWGSVLKMMIHPNKSTATEAVYKNVPPSAKGFMEEHMSNIKQGNTPGNQVFLNANDLNNPKALPYTRTLNDESKREFGFTSTREGNLKQNWYRNNQEDMRIRNALQGNIEGLLGAYHRGDTKQLAEFAKSYLRLDPEGTRIDDAINNGIPAQYMSQEQQRIAKANKLLAVQSLMRYRSMAK